MVFSTLYLVFSTLYLFSYYGGDTSSANRWYLAVNYPCTMSSLSWLRQFHYQGGATIWLAWNYHMELPYDWHGATIFKFMLRVPSYHCVTIWLSYHCVNIWL
jgi:hypothetical protein